jgi:hypothetical protein
LVTFGEKCLMICRQYLQGDRHGAIWTDEAGRDGRCGHGGDGGGAGRAGAHATGDGAVGGTCCCSVAGIGGCTSIGGCISIRSDASIDSSPGNRRNAGHACHPCYARYARCAGNSHAGAGPPRGRGHHRRPRRRALRRDLRPRRPAARLEPHAFAVRARGPADDRRAPSGRIVCAAHDGRRRLHRRNSKAFATTGFFEREAARTSEVFGQVAHVFSTYESRRANTDAKPFQRGINSIQLVNDGKRWWIVNLVWRAEDAGLPLPERYLPRN